MVALLRSSMLSQGHEYCLDGSCLVTHASFGFRRHEVLWSLHCGLCLCTDWRLGTTVIVASVKLPVLALSCVGHSRRFALLSSSGSRNVSLISVPALTAAVRPCLD